LYSDSAMYHFTPSFTTFPPTASKTTALFLNVCK
jgi:hypothetical protein